ncbi:MAG TPA: ferrochelatase [Candidatus Dormibacteraeota bacterium]|nr:ferrochelatase [Candidatus Dormibacteraeota bacterium]
MSKGVLLLNLGSPDSPSVSDVRRYLREFLMDPRVLDVNWLTRFAIVNFAILPTRPKESAHAYQKVWTKDGSPLVAISQRVCEQLQARLTVPVELCMRYQNPSIESALRKLAGQGVDEFLLIPLFPHFAMSSFETAVERVKELSAQIMPQATVVVQPPFYDDPRYIAALVSSAADFLARGFDHLLFSFHGLPERQLRKSDPTGCHCLATPDCCQRPSPAHETCYRAQCFKTVAAFVKLAGIPESKYSVAFQSRLGRDPWLKPYTDFELVRLPKEGKKRLLVVCPAFVSDCLETLEEIGMRGRDTFMEAGGKEFAQIPCLNEHPLWLEALQAMVVKFAPVAVRSEAPAVGTR